MRTEVEEGRFRAALFYRANVVAFSIAEVELVMLCNRDWPENICELKNCVRGAIGGEPHGRLAWVGPPCIDTYGAIGTSPASVRLGRELPVPLPLTRLARLTLVVRCRDKTNQEKWE